jgi:hypothetical protein
LHPALAHLEVVADRAVGRIGIAEQPVAGR